VAGALVDGICGMALVDGMAGVEGVSAFWQPANSAIPTRPNSAMMQNIFLII
jgi:hypothetical protein